MNKAKIFLASAWNFVFFLIRNLLISAAILSAAVILVPNQFAAVMSYLKPIPHYRFNLKIKTAETDALENKVAERDATLNELPGFAAKGVVTGQGSLETATEAEAIKPPEQPMNPTDEVTYLRHEVTRLREREKYLTQRYRDPASICKAAIEAGTTEVPQKCSWRSLFAR